MEALEHLVRRAQSGDLRAFELAYADESPLFLHFYATFWPQILSMYQASEF